MRLSKAIGFLLSFVLMASVSGCSFGTTSESTTPEISAEYTSYEESARVEDTRNLSDADYSMFNTVATDDFGRTFVTVDGKDDTKYVGMFYFICLGQNDGSTGIYDISVITDNGANDEAFQVNDASSPVGATHFWGEPVYGYYNSQDPWVARKHIELLTMAGIDFLIFDVSNAFTYKEVTDMLFEIMQEYYDAGWKVPKFMYYTAHDNGGGQNRSTIAEVYNNYYKNGKYRDLWFCPYEDGKPLITRHRITQYEPGDEIGDFFHFRYRQWPTEAFDEEGTPWIEFGFPQPVHSGWMNVSIATHAQTVRLSDKEANPGRGATWYGAGKTAYFVNDRANWRQGPHYEQQWDTVIDNKDNVDFAFVTGWNEWGASKMYDMSNNRYFTVDQYNSEFSRDIEPTRTDGMGDNFLLQTVRKIREYNAQEAKHYVQTQTAIDITKDDPAWDNVQTYLDFTGETQDRSFKMAIYGESRARLTNKTGRNDIESIKVTHDEQYLYLRVTTVKDVTAYEDGDTNWMNIWIKTANGAGDTLNGYNYVLNRSVSGNKTKVLRTRGKDRLVPFGEGDVYVYGKAMIVRVPLALMGLKSTDYTLDFKVTDNVNFDTDYMNLYDTGDAAPCGRFNFRYGY